MDRKELENRVLEELQKDGLSRRDALKLMGLASAGAFVGGTNAHAATEAHAISSSKSVNIVIVGGGAGGIMAAARLRKSAPNAKITLIAPNEVHLYQPGQVFMAAGLYKASDLKKPNSELMPKGVNWVKDKVMEFDPDNNKVKTAKNGEIAYDYMVAATGISYQYDKIHGLTEDMIGTNGISSVYLNNFEKGTVQGGEITWNWFKDMRKAAESASPDKPINVICTQPSTPIKCGGAPQKILYLSDDNLRGHGPHGKTDVSKNAKMTFTKKGGSLFGVPEYNQTLVDLTKEYGNIEDRFGHDLVGIDAGSKTAIYNYHYTKKGEWDEDLEEYEQIKMVEEVRMPYDFIHIVPPMSASNEFKASPLAWQKGTAQGWMEADQYTLQHRRYPNVFGIGDVLGIPKGKTGGSARHHGPVMSENLISVIEGKEPTAKFDGYTVCPLKTQYGKIMLAEFNYDGLAPSFPVLNPAEPRWIWWAFDLYALKPMYWYLMMRGLM